VTTARFEKFASCERTRESSVL